MIFVIYHFFKYNHLRRETVGSLKNCLFLAAIRIKLGQLLTTNMDALLIQFIRLDEWTTLKRIRKVW
jgi:hypothetical protein